MQGVWCSPLYLRHTEGQGSHKKERENPHDGFSLSHFVHSRLPYRILPADDCLLDEHFLAALDDDAAL